jgi:hypothetical protein
MFSLRVRCLFSHACSEFLWRKLQRKIGGTSKEESKWEKYTWRQNINVFIAHHSQFLQCRCYTMRLHHSTSLRALQRLFTFINSKVFKSITHQMKNVQFNQTPSFKQTANKTPTKTLQNLNLLNLFSLLTSLHCGGGESSLLMHRHIQRLDFHVKFVYSTWFLNFFLSLTT